jgi:hypothetical protein
MTAPSTREGDLLLLWTGLLAAPVAWLVQLEAGYALASWACARDRAAALHLVTALPLAVAGAGVLAAVRALGRPAPPPAAPARDGRRRLMGHVGLGLSVLFALVILVSGLPPLLLSPCTR